jgi:nucleotide-binding universal stress UspA family protein
MRRRRGLDRQMLPRFQHIVVPVDFTEKNLAALDVAFELAVANRARVTLLHVIETMDVESDAELEQFYARLQTRADSELERMAQRFIAAKIAVDRKIRFGKRLNEIVHDSADRHADLIVMSSHKPDLQKPAQTWATLSYQVSVLCSCPVLLVK